MTQESATDQFSGDEVGRRLENAPIREEAAKKRKARSQMLLLQGVLAKPLCSFFLLPGIEDKLSDKVRQQDQLPATQFQGNQINGHISYVIPLLSS